MKANHKAAKLVAIKQLAASGIDPFSATAQMHASAHHTAELAKNMRESLATLMAQGLESDLSLPFYRLRKCGHICGRYLPMAPQNSSAHERCCICDREAISLCAICRP